MIFDYSLAALVTAGLLVLPHLRSAAARAVLRGNDHDRHRLDSNPVVLRCHRRARAAARRLYDARLQRRAHIPLAGAASGRGGLSIGSAASTRSASSTGSPIRSPCCCSMSAASSILYALMRFQAALPFNPAGQSAVAPDLSFNTAVSFITNTNWQNYGGESTMSYLMQMLGLTAPELPVGRDRYRARGRADPRLRARIDEDRGQFLGRYHPLHALHPAADLRRLRIVPGLAGHAADARPVRDAATLEGAKQTIAVGPVASQVAIKMLGTNGGGFFNANAAHPFENPDRAVELYPDGLDLRDRRRAHQRVRPHGRQPAAGLGHLWRDGSPVRRGRHGVLLGRGARQRRLHGARPHRRQHGRQGVALRHRGLRAVRRGHDRRLLRRRQRHARFLHRARRHDPADQHAARRGRSSAASAPACTACCCSS